jgi:pimeloyl-ACP methyl ester carboxylesterase
MPYLQANEIQLYYENQGQGPSLLLIGGLGFGGWIWHRQVSFFSQSFKTITFDNRGSGLSDKPDENYTIEMLTSDTIGLLDSLRIQRANIVGVSLGGLIAQKLALDYPNRVETLVLCSTVFGGPNVVLPPMEVLQFMAQPAEGPEERFAKGLRYSFSSDFISQEKEEIEFIRKKMSEPRQPDSAYRRQVMAPLGFNVEARLMEIKIPTLIVAGSEDKAVPVANAQRLAARIAHSQLHILEGSGHLCFIEASEKFNQLVMEFLLKHQKDHTQG